MRLVVAVLALVSVDAVGASNEAKRLFDDLLSNYNKLIRPVGNSSDRLTVKMGLKLSQIIGVDMKRQIMITNVWVQQEWFDYKLTWDPSDYGGVKHLHVPSQDIWLPDIVLYNNADGNYEVTIMTKAILHYTGKVTWNPPAIYKSSCEIDVEFFPFDEQECFMKFGSWTYDGYKVDLRHLNQPGGVMASQSSNTIPMGMDLRDYYISTEWDIMTVPAVRHEKYYPCCEEPFPDIYFYLHLRRKSLFYTVNVIIPCVGISFLSLLVFYLPSDSGEKVSLSISILLSLTVFFLLLAEIIPPTSKAVPLLGKYLLFTMILVTLSVVVTVGVLNVNFRTPSTHKMAPWVRKTFVELLPKYLFIQRPEREEEAQLVTDRESLDDTSMDMRGNTLTSDQTAILDDNNSELGAKPNQMPLWRTNAAELLQNKACRSPLMLRPSKIGPEVVGGKWLPRAGQPLMPAVRRAINALKFVAQHVRNKDTFEECADDWKYVAMVLDRILLWLFGVACVTGTIGIIMAAPSHYDHRQPIDVQFSNVHKRDALKSKLNHL